MFDAVLPELDAVAVVATAVFAGGLACVDMVVDGVVTDDAGNAGARETPAVSCGADFAGTVVGMMVAACGAGEGGATEGEVEAVG